MLIIGLQCRSIKVNQLHVNNTYRALHVHFHGIQQQNISKPNMQFIPLNKSMNLPFQLQQPFLQLSPQPLAVVSETTE